MILALLEENSLSALFSTLEQVRVESIRDGLYEVSFTDVLPSRRLIYPCDYQLEPELILALEEAIQSIHDSGCYADVLHQWTYRDSEGNLDTTLSRYCYIATDQFRYALDEDGIAKALSNKDNSFVFADQWALYSVEAQWGLHVDGNGQYALLAGTEEFMNIFNAKFPLIKNGTQDFLSYWKNDCRCDKDNLEAPWNWLTRLMIQVYGQKQAFELMDEFNMFQLSD